MNIDELSINALRIVSNEAINKASSGHPGMALSSAGIAYTLFTKILKITSKESKWINRDRFILGSGHASALLYTNLHLAGYKVSIDDLKNFRQLDSLTPGHPELFTDGVDCASGPLGQGIGHAVGMAMAEKFLSEKYNKEDCEIFNNYTYCLCGDGDMEEGISYEAMSLASRLNLNKLILIYDCNDCTLDGPLSYSSNEKLKDRFKAMNFNVLEVNGLDHNEVEKALKKAKKFESNPTVIFAHTIIGYLSSKQGDCATHGSPIGDDLNNIKTKLNWNYEPFEIPQEVYDNYAQSQAKNYSQYRKWNRNFKLYKMKYCKEYDEIRKAFNLDFSDVKYPTYSNETSEATRVSFGKVINEIAPQIPTLLGGASDVAKSVNTLIKGENKFGLEENGRNVFYGIREFAMSLAQSGMLLYGGVRPYIGCFLVFSDYMKASIRTAALMKLPSLNVFTHDSIAVGEDGPTHQPIEQVTSLRLIPNCYTFRPCGANETVNAVRFGIENKSGPVNLVLSRQAMVTYESNYEDFIKGGYVVSFEEKKIDVTLIATGSEVDLCLKTKEDLKSKGIDVRVVSIPCLELFKKQSQKYINSVLGTDRDNIIAVEMMNADIWYQFAHKVYGINEFGASGKASDVLNKFGFNVEELSRFIVDSLN